MLLLLPLVAFVFLFAIFRRIAMEWREAFLSAAVSWGVLIVLVTEGLSVPRLLSRGPVAISWALLSVLLLACLRFLPFKASASNSSPCPISFESLDRADRALLSGIAFIALCVFGTALLSAPNMWDAMEYHLPRVAMWMSNHDVRFFPTPDYCQLIYGSWAEYASMHSMLLSGTDRFVNLVQFFSYFGSIIAISLVAKSLGATLRGQIIAAVICASIPEGVLEASGPMNTFVVTFWIAAALALLLAANEHPSWLSVVLVGASAGLAVCTKGTTYVILPFLVLGAWWMGSRSSRTWLLRRSYVMLLPILFLNLPQYIRNYEFTRSPLGIPLPVAFGQTVLSIPFSHITVLGTLSNALRNLALHLGTPIESLNARIESLLRLAVRSLGNNPDDPSAVIWNQQFHVNHFSLNEAIAGNPLHLLLIVLSIFILIWTIRAASSRRSLVYLFGIVLAFLLFCALLRWQPWSSRYHLPFFVMASALIGFVLETHLPRRVAGFVTAFVLIAAFPSALVNRLRPLIPFTHEVSLYQPRCNLYFANQHQFLAPSYFAAADRVLRSNCSSVAIDSYTSIPDSQITVSPDSWFVYPLIALIHTDGAQRTVWYSGVHNVTSRYEQAHVHPPACAVICLGCANIPAKWEEYRHVAGHASVFDNVVVFAAEGDALNADPYSFTNR